MVVWVLAVLLFVDLGPTFQNASAFARPAPGDMVFVDVQVEVVGDVNTVVAHFIDPGDNQQTVTLINRGGAFYGGQAEVERANLLVVFEVINQDGSSEQSLPTDLVSMGVDPRVLQPSLRLGPLPTDDSERGPLGIPAWGWLIVAVVAATLSGLALWAMRDYPQATDRRAAE